MYVPICLVVVAALGFAAANPLQDACYNYKVDFYELMGTRTAYEYVKGNGDLRPLKDPTCKPLQMWVMARHGTKYPENKDVPKLLRIVEFRDQILENHANGSGQLCDKEIRMLRDWVLDPALTVNTSEELTPQGEIDHRRFAERLKKAYPELLDFSQNAKTTDLVFTSTSRQRTQKSRDSFMEGISGDADGAAFVKNDVTDRDLLLMPHKNCEAWNVEYSAKNLSGQREAFDNGPEMNGILADVSRRLGFRDTLSYDSVKTAYDMCRYEVAWYPGIVSVWCSIFKRADLEIFEYSEDLEFYYCCGPGREMSGRLGCNALADMFGHFEKVESGKDKDQPKGLFYFGHSMTLQLALAAMGIGKEDVPFTSETYATASERKYHVSKLGPFATNIVAVLHRCEGTVTNYKVVLLVSEAAAPIDVCKNGVCEWEDLKTKYGSVAKGCDHKFCEAT